MNGSHQNQNKEETTNTFTITRTSLRSHTFRCIIQMNISNRKSALPVFCIACINFIRINCRLRLNRIYHSNRRNQDLRTNNCNLSFFGNAISRSAISQTNSHHVFRITIRFSRYHLILFMNNFYFLVIMYKHFVIQITSRLFFRRSLITNMVLLLMLRFTFTTYRLYLNKYRFNFRISLIRFNSRLPYFSRIIVIYVRLISSAKRLHTSFSFHCQLSYSNYHCHIQGKATTRFNNFRPSATFQHFTYRRPSTSNRSRCTCCASG